MDTPPPVLPSAPAYRDRRAGLIVFGILEIILGGLCALMLPLMVFGQVMAAKQHGGGFDFALAAPTLLSFSALAVSLVWLGIGSMLARRWARALLLCLGWLGLCVGLCSLAVVIPTLGSMEEILGQQGQTLPPEALAFAKFFAVATLIVIYVLIPGALVLFYRSPNVKRTCEARDPVERWTDRCPLPVLAMCLLQALGAIYMLLMPRFSSVMPVAGFLVTGWSARILWFGFTGVTLYAAWGFYRLRYRAWLIYTALVALFTLSYIATFFRVDLLEYYRLVGLPEWQIQQIVASPVFRGHSFVWIMVLSTGLYGGYLLFLRRYFTGAKNPPAPPGGDPAP